MTGSSDASGSAQFPADPEDTPAGAPVPVAQEKTDGPMDSAEFAERLDVDPDRDDVKG